MTKIPSISKPTNYKPKQKTSCMHQHKRAYRSIQAQLQTCAPRHRSSKGTSYKASRTYTHHSLVDALKSYQQICKTRQQHAKSMRQVAFDYHIPFTTFQRHVYAYIKSTHSLHANKPTSPALPPSNDLPPSLPPSAYQSLDLVGTHNNCHVQRDISPVDQTIIDDSLHTYIDNATNAGGPTLFTKQQESNIKFYINEMADINLPLTKPDVIIMASDYATKLGIKITNRNALLSDYWWKGNTHTYSVTYTPHTPQIHIHVHIHIPDDSQL
jgi:hypothetical protein